MASFQTLGEMLTFVYGKGRKLQAAEVREQYRRMAKVMHPDAGGDAGAFQLLRENYGKCLEKVGDQ